MRRKRIELSYYIYIANIKLENEHEKTRLLVIVICQQELVLDTFEEHGVKKNRHRYLMYDLIVLSGEAMHSQPYSKRLADLRSKVFAPREHLRKSCKVCVSVGDICLWEVVELGW